MLTAEEARNQSNIKFDVRLQETLRRIEVSIDQAIARSLTSSTTSIAGYDERLINEVLIRLRALGYKVTQRSSSQHNDMDTVYKVEW